MYVSQDNRAWGLRFLPYFVHKSSCKIISANNLLHYLQITLGTYPYKSWMLTVRLHPIDPVQPPAAPAARSQAAAFLLRLIQLSYRWLAALPLHSLFVTPLGGKHTRSLEPSVCIG